jgi:hypothetical protein
MAKRKKRKTETRPELGANLPEEGTLTIGLDDPVLIPPTSNVVRVGHWCDLCHGMFEVVYHHPSAPDVPLCARCLKFVERRATRSLQTPTNPERV